MSSVPNPFKDDTSLNDVNLDAPNDMFAGSSKPAHEQDAFLSTSIGADVSGTIEAAKAPAPSVTRSAPASNNAPASKPATASSRFCAFLSVEYYQPYFDVSTKQVLERMSAAVMPWKGQFFDLIDNKPDLYGPFWIMTTLVFLIAATSNFASWLTFHGDDGTTFKSDFTLLTFAAWFVYGCGIAMPVLAWGVLHYTNVKGFALMNLICIYGYSIIAYLPASVLCVVPNAEVQWLVAVLAFLMSSTFLLKNLWGELSGHVLPELNAESGTSAGRKRVIVMLVGLTGLHLVFSLMLKLYFFHNINVAELYHETAAPTALIPESVATPAPTGAAPTLPPTDGARLLNTTTLP